ncbi:uncharacterized protein LOC126980826 [Eriocheir sinensis]|uniref:uncharacterized protein LOC126980826 n=1 Tax=Eriocheir sinensis TaxID=95602 RepID=UPI0021C58D82|nr:uncharacterized protein LOC126980826 [Eriocheir sinensis]XP_050687057.1 uncharacterized protein LOC126980826 [Eriocheir sinensis]XP_050687058.1 uncharacterized protein LOC126980826 [Eriocheir sinensis]XP_050687059.1 uncharacterized protein LOC126980826 [Eriocheir sinensis]XP_050687060.1 uncharacterized protein LOC126980826 [Eriocheir sinensis]
MHHSDGKGVMGAELVGGAQEVDGVHQAVYRVVLPLLVFLGLAANALCLLVLTRPNLRSTRVNWYFIALASSDLLVCIFHIPVITTITGCTFSSYAEALYFTHFGWTLVGVCQTFGLYVIVWLSFDRFVAVWMYEVYPKIQQQPNVKRNRLLVTAVACVIFHLVYMVQAEVRCDSPVDGDEACEYGHWAVVSGYQYMFYSTWHKVYSVFYGLLIRWVPNCLLIFFNTSLVVGVMQGRVNLPAGSQTPGGSGERNLIIITIAITISYALFTLPIMIYITGYAGPEPDRCSAYHPKEVLRAVGNSLQLFEHVIHIAFYIGLNRPFRNELKYLLRLEERPEEGLGSGRSQESLRADEECLERGQRKGNSLELPRASPSLPSSTQSRQTLTQDLGTSRDDLGASRDNNGAF